MLELNNKQYDMQTLKENIFDLSLRDILKTQKLTCEFCVKYILNTNYQFNKEDINIAYQENLAAVHSVIYIMVSFFRRLNVCFFEYRNQH